MDTFNAYPHLLHRGLKERFPNAVFNVTVTAIGGEHSESGARRFERDLRALRPDMVTVDYSLNDRILGLARAAAAWRSMITKATTRGIKVILLTPTPDLAARLDESGDPLARHAEQARRLARELGVGLVDSLAASPEPALAGSAGSSRSPAPWPAEAGTTNNAARAGRALPELMSQGKHPNRTGHERVAAELVRWFPRP